MTSNLLTGYWVLDFAIGSAHEVGVTHLRFTSEGLLQEGNENDFRIYVLSFDYWIDQGKIATICPPNPRIELTPFSIAEDGRLNLSFGNGDTLWCRSKKKQFFESKNIWNPGFLFERQMDYMSLLDIEPPSYLIERALMLRIAPEVLVNTAVLWRCWKYGHSTFASFHLEDFEQILARGVLIDDEDNEVRTLLSYLAEDGNTHAIQKVLEHGADINHNDLCNNTALDYATWANRTETAQLLKSLGAVHGTGFSKI